MKAVFNTTWRIPLKYLVKLLIVIAPLLVSLIYAQITDSWQPLELATKLLACIVVLLFVALFVYPVNQIKLNLLDILFIGFNGWICLSSFYNGLDYKTLYPVFVMLAYYFLIRLVVSNNNIDRNIIILPIVLTSLLIVVYVLMQHIGIISNNINFQFKYTGFFIHPAPLAGYLVFCTPILVYALFQLPKTMCFIIISLVISTVFLYVLYKTQSRAAYFSLISGLGVFLLFKYQKLNSKLLQQILLYLVSIVLICIVLYFLYRIRPVSGLGRLFVWKISVNIFKDYPILGVGYDRFNVFYMKYQAAYFSAGGSIYEKLNAQIVLFPFNEFIRVLTECGVIGLLLLISLFAVAFTKLVKGNRDVLKQVLISSITIIVVFACFSYPLSVVPLQLLFSFFMAITASITTSRKTVLLPINKYVTATFSCVLFIVFIRDYQQSKKWGSAITNINFNKEEALLALGKLHAGFNNYGPFLYDYGIELVRAKRFHKAISVLLKEANLYNGNDQNYFLALAYLETKNLEKATAVYLNQHDIEPGNLLPLYKILLMEIESGNKTRMIEIATKILNTKCVKLNLKNNEILKNCNKILVN